MPFMAFQTMHKVIRLFFLTGRLQPNVLVMRIGPHIQ